MVVRLQKVGSRILVPSIMDGRTDLTLGYRPGTLSRTISGRLPDINGYLCISGEESIEMVNGIPDAEDPIAAIATNILRWCL